ncbi:phosphoribosylglycinamide formyltransferase [Spirochaetia bacterium]|nr:phosphoribosylglycinamide formyltransferase [Spirochaetia bacterium]
MNIVVLVSGNGSNLQALIDAEHTFDLGGSRIAAVIADRSGIYAEKRSEAAGIPFFTEIPDKALATGDRRRKLSDRILEISRSYNADLIVQAGFLSILAGDIVNEYAGRIINLHPSLLPKFGGKKMYGAHVHQAVLDAGETESGCTVHIVDASIDTGPLLLQRKVPVMAGDSAESLAERIHAEEHKAIVDAVRLMAERLSE